MTTKSTELSILQEHFSRCLNTLIPLSLPFNHYPPYVFAYVMFWLKLTNTSPASTSVRPSRLIMVAVYVCVWVLEMGRGSGGPATDWRIQRLDFRLVFGDIATPIRTGTRIAHYGMANGANKAWGERRAINMLINTITNFARVCVCECMYTIWA